jgi:hypothetical protein
MPEKTNAASNAPKSHINDSGRFFTPQAVESAKKRIESIKNEFNRDIVVESFTSIPEADRTKFQQMDRAGQDKYVSDWAERRTKELNVNGVYMLICRQPSKLHVRTTQNSVSRDVQLEIQSKLLSAFRSRQFDDGLLSAIESARNGMQKRGK